MLDFMLDLPASYRARVLGNLDRLIAHLEGSAPSSTCERKTASATRAARSAAGDKHLVLLRRNRQVLLTAQSPAACGKVVAAKAA